MHAQLVHELDLPLLRTIGMERGDAIVAIDEARAQHWLARTEMGYCVTRLEDVTAVLRDKRFHSALSILPQMSGLPGLGQPGRRRSRSILSMEGEEHARLRRLVAPAFTPASANRLRPTMRAVITELIDTVSGAGRCELVTDVCEPYPIPIVCELLGAPARTGSSSPRGPPISSGSSTARSKRTSRSSSGPPTSLRRTCAT